MKTKILALVMTVLMITSFAAVFPVRAFANYVQVQGPGGLQNINLWSDVNSVGDTFNVGIVAYVEGSPGFYGYEYVLSWTPGVIDCITETLNTAIWPAYNGPWISTPIDNVAGTYHQSITAKAPSTPVTGTFVLANLTFQIVAPAPFGGVVSTPLNVGIAPGYTAYVLLDTSASEIPHDYKQGAYFYHWAPPTAKPYLEVIDPSGPDDTYVAKNVGEVFPMEVRIRNVDAGWRLAGVEFLMDYNATLIQVLSANQGTFFDAFTPVTFWYNDTSTPGLIRAAYTILDIGGMTPPYTPPGGYGVIATIYFNTLIQGIFPETYSCKLNLYIDTPAGMGSFFVDYLGGEIIGGDPLNGTYTMLPKVLGRRIDVFTQYPDPFGGQGPMQPSDMFWPQKEVELYANVTYNEWPVQNKMVAFEVRKVNGEIVDIIYGITNETGTAHASYRIPWPCFNTSTYFGVWTITATVDLYCVVVNDTLQFHFDYLVHWLKVETDKPAYNHGEIIIVTIDFGSHSQMPRDVLFTVSVHDEVNQPIGVAATWYTVYGTVFCQLKNDTVVLEIPIPKWAAAGVATIYVGALSNWPSLGGSPWAPGYGFDPLFPLVLPPTVNILAS